MPMPMPMPTTSPTSSCRRFDSHSARRRRVRTSGVILRAGIPIVPNACQVLGLCDLGRIHAPFDLCAQGTRFLVSCGRAQVGPHVAPDQMLGFGGRSTEQVRECVLRIRHATLRRVVVESERLFDIDRDSVATLAEVFSEYGYRTGAFVSAAVLDRKYGLHRGYTTYDDDVIRLDEHGITIKSYYYPGHRRFIAYETIRSAAMIELGSMSGRHRLVGIGFRRPRHFFHWDRTRSTKTLGIELDTGRRIQTVITPTDPGPVLEAVERQIAGSSTP
jgi:hypothetical protein